MTKDRTLHLSARTGKARQDSANREVVIFVLQRQEAVFNPKRYIFRRRTSNTNFVKLNPSNRERMIRQGSIFKLVKL